MQTKQRKDKAETLKAEALKESRERAQKRKKLLQNYRKADAKFPKIFQLCRVIQTHGGRNFETLHKSGIRTSTHPSMCISGYTGADLNSMSYETWVVLGKPKLCASSTRIATYAGDYDQVEGILILLVFINDTNLAHKFYVMKPKRMVSPIILGQPWQRQYNCWVNWKKEGILYEENDQ